MYKKDCIKACIKYLIFIMEGIYLIHPREFVSTDLSIYKLGRSNNIDNRVKQYPKGSNILCMLMCKNSIACENYLINLFKNKFTQNTYYGSEYFEGDKQMMIREIFNHLDEQYVKNKKIEAEIEAKKKAEIEAKKEAEIEAKKKADKIVKTEVKIEDIIVNDIIEDTVINDIIEDINVITNCKNNRSCPKCKEKFKYPSTLKKHLINSSRCSMTEQEFKIFYNPETIAPIEPIAPIETTYSKSKVKIQENKSCNKCNRVFTRISSLERHQKEIKCYSNNIS